MQLYVLDGSIHHGSHTLLYDRSAVVCKSILISMDYLERRNPRVMRTLIYRNLLANCWIDAQRGCIMIYCPGVTIGRCVIGAGRVFPGDKEEPIYKVDD